MSDSIPSKDSKASEFFNQANLQKVADLSPNILFVIELREQRVLYINQRVKELLGHNIEYIYNQGSEIFKMVIHPEDYELRMENLEKCKDLSDEEESMVEVRLRVVSEEWQWFRITDKIFEREKGGTVSKVIGTAQNIHSQKIYKEKLKEEKRRYKNAQAIGHIGSFERNLPGNSVTYSEEFYHILGLEPKQEEISIEEFMSHVHPEDRETYKTAIAHTHATGEPLDIVNRVIPPDGSIRHVHRREAIMYNKQGEPIRVYGTVQDVTERIIAEEERKKLEWLMLSTEKIAGTGSYEVDLSTNKLYLSDGLYLLLFEEPENVEPTLEWLDSRSDPEDVARVRQTIERAIEKKEPYTYTRRIYKKDGSIRFLEAQGSIISDAEGNPIKVIGLVQDVTDRKKAEEKLRRSEERSRNLLNVLQNTPNAYLIIRPDLHIEMASDAYREATGTKNKNIVGKYLFEVFPDNPAIADASGVKNLRASLEEVLSSKKPHRMSIQQYDVQRQDGSFEEKFWSPINAPVLSAEGEVEYIIHRVLDVTEVMKKQDTFKGLTSKTEMLKNSLEEIKNQADQLKESRALLESVFDASPNSIVLYKTIYDDNDSIIDFEFMMVNSFTFITIGQDRNIIGKRLSEVFPNSVAAGILNYFKITAGTGEPVDFDTYYQGENSYHWLHFRAAKLNDLLVVTSEDITERKRSQETLQQMLNGSITAITILESVRDEQGKITDFVFKGGNKAAEFINGISTKEVVGKGLLELFPGVKDVLFESYVEVVEKGEPMHIQKYYNYEHFDHWFDISAVKNGDGFILTYLDITEQKNAEQELVKLKNELAQRAAESEDRFRALVTASSDTVYKMSSDWNLLYNLDGKNFLTDKNAASNNWLEEYVPEYERPRLLENIRESIRTKSIFELEYQVFDVDGNVQWVYSRAIPKLNDEGEIVEWLGAASNISPRKKAEERQSFLLKLSDALRYLTDPEKIIDIAMKNLGNYLDVNRAYYGEALGDGDTLLTRSGYLKEVPPLPERIKISKLDAGIRNFYLQGHILVLNDIEKDLEPNPEMDEARKIKQIRACIGVPLVKNEKLLAVVGVHQSKPRQWTAEDIALVEEVCERTWAAVERARAEKALREAQESLSIALEAAQMGTWILDLKTSTSKRNFRHDQIFGYNEPQPHWNIEVAKKHVLKEDHHIFDEAFAIALTTGKLQLEVRVLWQDNSIHWMAINGHFYFDENGNAVRAAGVNFEVTERRQAEQALQESEQRFRNLVEASALAVWETDSEGEVNVDSPSWRNFTGQTYEEWIGTGWSNVVHPDDKQAAVHNWKNAVKTRKSFDYEFRLRSAEGDYRWTNIKAIPILDLEGNVIKWSGMNLDIHEQKLAEENLRKAKEEAEEASRAKEDFVSTMSHEIRTPLNAIIGLSNLLMEQKPREDQKENLSSLSFSARNLLVLINDILDFSKLEAGKMEIGENPFNLHDLLFNLQKAHKPQAEANGTEIILELEEKIPQIISTDQVKLSQILHNLVSNAVKFTRNGIVKISVELNRQEKDEFWLDFAVEDSGIGIAADKVDHIFDKFAQAESSTVRNYGGTGLGLSITKLLLELLGSEIKLESRLGEGSRFFFKLPVKIGFKDVVPKERKETLEEKKNLSHLQLLLVEDVEINRNIIMQFLQNWWQLKPDEAVNGKDAVEMARQKTYDLILMDVRMPVMDGYEATEQIRKIPGYQKTPILALKADKNQEAQQARQATQFSDLLTKPFDPKTLKQRIQQHLSFSGKNLQKIEQNIKTQKAGKPPKIEEVQQEQINTPSFVISRYQKVSGGNEEVFEKLVGNAIRAMETYRAEFKEAAKEENSESLLNLVHKNTTSIHYIQANKLAGKIEEFRNLLKAPAAETEKLTETKGSILMEFDKVIEGLKLLKK